MCVLFAAPALAGKPKVPKMVFKSTQLDMGTAYLSDTTTVYSVDFTFKNKGKADLLITRVTPDCHCTTVEYPKDPIPPKETGTIRAIFDHKIFLPGELVKSIYLRTNSQEDDIEISYKVTVNY